jgi:hypothetical protein
LTPDYWPKVAELFRLKDERFDAWVELTFFVMGDTPAMTFFARRAGYRTVRGV